jgi:regulatory protein
MPYTSRISIKEAKLKAASFCTYRERTQQELRDKLYGYGLFSDEVEEVIAYMITHNFLNEERYAKTYAGGKFRVNDWGKVKILYHLKQKGLSAYCIKQGLKEIEEVEYVEKVDSIISKKENRYKSPDLYLWKKKMANYLISKGFENDLVWERINFFFNVRKFSRNFPEN